MSHPKQKTRKGKKQKTGKKNSSGKFVVKGRWELPAILKEVSGISIIDDELIACVQDEAGCIFIFNKNTGKIEREIIFGDKGDYEGITWTGESFFVIRADGMLFEVNDPWDEEPGITLYETGFDDNDNVESVGFDSMNNRLLLTGKTTKGHKHKPIKAFLLESRSMSEQPAMVIDMNDKAFIKPDKTRRSFRASAIGIHPITGQLYIPDGPKSRMLVVTQDGAVVALHKFNADEIPQPEGISFSESGDIFLSTEGKDTHGAILHLEFVQ